MRHKDDKRGSKFFFIAIVIIVVYLGAFNFDIKSAYLYTIKTIVSQYKNTFPASQS